MKTELIVASKKSGKVMEVSRSVTEVTYTTNRTGYPGQLEFTLLKAGELSFYEGDTVRFSVEGKLVFFGWVFTKSKDRWGVISVTCYDRIRYLKASASYAFYNQSASDILKQVAGDLQLELGAIADTGYKIPSLVEEDQSCIDIIEGAIHQTLLNTGDIYVMFDDGKGISLQKPENMKSSIMLGDRSLVTDYTYKTDIDQQTYNSIKLARPNEETGRADVVIAQDSSNIGQWGLLQLYQTVDGDVNDAQMKSQAETMLNYYNRVTRTLSVTSLGVPGLRAGMMIFLKISGFGDMKMNQYVLLEKVTHTFANDLHTMDFETLPLK